MRFQLGFNDGTRGYLPVIVAAICGNGSIDQVCRFGVEDEVRRGNKCSFDDR